ncbi:MAG: precorrin-2 C(20)-methyltransferase [Gammaproteobacteria bacterium]|nr:precorrin-2 C(20)-methyltransferase [Gammaproteobacteria bacterium]MDH5802178.1 precorrin-2 C(20)-methyltransferase [Gammaproteobacteria bacterium]
MTEKSLGKLYGVSLGPGDPGLITRRAWELLNRKDTVWTYPIRKKNSDSYALAIALRAGLELPTQQSPLIFPMTHDVEILSKYWLQAAQAVLTFLQQGQDVVFLVEGDASTYSTFGHLSRSVRALDDAVRIETVAGVPSFHAAAAALDMPLADVDDTVAIIPAGYGVETIASLLPQFDTLVLLKVKPLLDDIIDLLQQQQIASQCRFIEKVGTPEERVVRDITTLKGQKVNYLSLMLVRNPHRQRHPVQRGCRKPKTQNKPEIQSETVEISA